MPPLAGRRLWFVGIGGAGLSVVRVPRPRVGRRGGRLGPASRRRTCAQLRGRRGRASRPSRSCPTAGRSSSRARTRPCRARSRADFLAELVSLRRAIVVAGAHGKTTTTAMIAFVLAELGLDPAWLVGGEIAAARRQRRRGGGLARRRGRRVRPHGRAAPARDRGRDERRARPPLDLRLGGRGRGAVRPLARRGAARRARLGARAGVVRARVPGEHNRRNAAAALAALELAGVARADAEPVLARFRGAGRRFERRRRGERRHGRRRLRAPSDRDRGDGRGRARADATDACSSSSSRTSTRGRGTSRTSSAPRSRPPTPSA